MGLFDRFKKVAEPTPAVADKKPRVSKPRVKKTKVVEPVGLRYSAKDIATAAGEPYVAVLNVELDIDNVGNGAFELDWNDTFLARLVKAGYQGKTDADIVDLWFKEICRNVLLETYEQEQADPDKRVLTRKDLGDGRTEIG